MSATSSNHAKILAIHEASRECVWLRSMTQHIRESCGISLGQESPTVVHEDNATCIAQLKDRYIKGDKTKHILPKFFFTHDLQKSGDIIVQKVHSSDNQADLSTKALPTTTFKKLVHDTGMRRLNQLKKLISQNGATILSGSTFSPVLDDIILSDSKSCQSSANTVMNGASLITLGSLGFHSYRTPKRFFKDDDKKHAEDGDKQKEIKEMTEQTNATLGKLRSKALSAALLSSSHNRDMSSSSSIGFTSFGGGLRLCPGLDLARLEASVCLHHFDTKFRYIAWRNSGD
ncbi:retrovirus-related pol polyprotein from transposon TNT 1-94 [Tanacetum coccineum]|uniref:Retrovirus-related pol polyprotein from transposon TNT 1-94 n=2 Tax=Tanacetum coccineum TaxID=301880 RepID=A0ABQ5BMD0_9ASTR